MLRIKYKIQEIDIQEAFEVLFSRKEGLDNAEILQHQKDFGENSIEQKESGKYLILAIKQFTNFFTILLLVSAGICLFAEKIKPGESMNILGYTLIGVSVLNAAFSFFQVFRAEKAMEALKELLPDKVSVKRSGQIQEIHPTQLVPGDIVLLEEGDKIPADCRLLEVQNFKVDNSSLTGESVPIPCKSDPTKKDLLEANNIIFTGCTVSQGKAQAIVFAIGKSTEFGKIAHLSQEVVRTQSPLEKETSNMVKTLTIIAFTMGFIFFLYGFTIGRGVWVNLVFMMGIIVANVPEGLLPTFTLALALGGRKMAEKKVLVKNLNAVEALGATEVICTDKTGTLTENKLKISLYTPPIHSLEFKNNKELFDLSSYSLIASEVLEINGKKKGDPMDVCIHNYWMEKKEELNLDIQFNTLRFFPFDILKKASGGIGEYENGSFYYCTKGAWEEVSQKITKIRINNDVLPITKEQLKKANEHVERLSKKGLRVITIAFNPIEKGQNR